MSELKTKPTSKSVIDFLDSVKHPQRKQDGFELLELMKNVTGEKPVMWGERIIGFGSYHYKYESGREGNWFKIGFSPRKRSLTIYLKPSLEEYDDLLEKLGKHRTGVGCIYINKLSDVVKDVLKEIIERSMEK